MFYPLNYRGDMPRLTQNRPPMEGGFVALTYAAAPTAEAMRSLSNPMIISSPIKMTGTPI